MELKVLLTLKHCSQGTREQREAPAASTAENRPFPYLQHRPMPALDLTLFVVSTGKLELTFPTLRTQKAVPVLL